MHYLAGIALFLLACQWMREIVRRLPQDIGELREPGQNERKAAIVLVWALTLALPVPYLCGLAVDLVRAIASLG